MRNSDYTKSLFKELRDRRGTLLGVGPMSLRIVEETIKLANETKKPIALIPSRRQVECSGFGGGYANNWSTESFSKFVREADRGGYILLSRDHSGPWQFRTKNKQGSSLTYKEAMEEAKASLRVDIESDFDLIHLDPSQGLEFQRSQQDVINDILDLNEFCCGLKGGREVIYELGADEQSMIPDLPSIAEEKLSLILERLKGMNLPSPMFYVLQTGTKVKELRNIGSFATRIPVRDMLPAAFQIPEILKICQSYGVYLKEHNADYLPEDSLSWHKRLGIPAANVAPEFAVAETRAIIDLAKQGKQDWFLELFYGLVLKEGKWQKWMMPNSKATDEEKILIAGHYHYSNPEISEAIDKLSVELKAQSIQFDAEIRRSVRKSILRFLKQFGYYD